MNILVCVKQVPDTTEIKINPETNTLIREGVPSILNTYDRYALEIAARIKDNQEAKIVAVSMGPEQAKNALKDCLSLGADKAYLVSDRKFGGSDTLATGYILSKAIKHIEEKEGLFDLIFCGKQAIDGDTAQTGPQLAELLDYPQITCITDVTVKGTTIETERETEYGKEVWESPLPVLLTVTKPAFKTRYPSIMSKLAANRADIPVVSTAEIQPQPERIGLSGSPTKVKKTFVPPRKSDIVIIREATAKESAAKLVSLLGENKLI